MSQGTRVTFVRAIDRAMYGTGVVHETNMSGCVVAVDGYGLMFFYSDEVKEA